MTQYVSLDELLAKREPTDSGMPEGEVPVSGLGAVRVRGLSRGEVLAGKDIDERLAFEVFLISTGMVSPKMTAAQALSWLSVGRPTELEPVTKAIIELSGLGDDAEKRAVAEMFEDPSAEFRDVPSGPTGDDAGSDAQGDEQR